MVCAEMLVLHNDADREYAYGPARVFPHTKVGTFTQHLYDEAKKDGSVVMSMKNDWKHIFGFSTAPSAKRQVTSLDTAKTACTDQPPAREPRSLSRRDIHDLNGSRLPGLVGTLLVVRPWRHPDVFRD